MEENGRLVQFLYDHEKVVAERDEDRNMIRHIRGYELISSDSEKAKTYYHYASDELGSITHVIDDTGNVLNHYEYDVFGNFAVKEETVPNRFGFAGEQFDPATELYYLRARFYNPVIGRFIQEDTYYGDGLNLYTYCHNNPVGYVDPSGNSEMCPNKQLAIDYLQMQGLDEDKALAKYNELIAQGKTPEQARKAITNNSQLKVIAKFEHDGNTYYDVNPTARDSSMKNNTIIPGPEGQKGLSNVNNTTNKAHAEIGAMNQSRVAGNKGGNAILTVTGKKVCTFCKSDIKKMALTLELDNLTVVDKTAGKVYVFNSQSGDFYNIKDGGKRWK